MRKNIGSNTNKNLNGKYSQNVLDHAKETATVALQTTSKRAIQRTAEPTGDLTCNEIANEITKISKTSPQNDSETNANELEKKNT